MAHGFGDSVDAFVTGWERGDADAGFKDLIGDLLLSVNLIKEDGSKEEHVIAKISNLPLVERRAITIFDEAGNMQLRPDYMGKVGVVEGQCISSRARRLVHPRLIEWRNDKGPDQCTFDEGLLKKLIL